MFTKTYRRLRQALMLLLVLAIATVSTASRVSPGAAQSLASDGMLCTTKPSPAPTFSLTTRTGYIGTPDGNVLYMWGFSEGSSPFQYPGPVLCVNEGDTVTVILQNTLAQHVSIIFPGQEDVLANGAPAQPQFDGSGKLTSLTNTAAAGGGSVTYQFVATKPGTYLYESGTNPSIQVPMGLFGALVVRPSMGADYAYNRADSQFQVGKEYINIFSEIDPYLSQAVEAGRPFNMNNYHPRYWLINGRGFPDTIAPNNASWLPAQPYGALSRINPYDPVNNPLPALVRYLSVGTTDYPMHPHGNNFKVIARDGSPLEGPAAEDLAYDKFSIPVGPGQTWDAAFTWHDAEGYDADTNPVPITIPNLQNLLFGTFYSGSPYLGENGAIPVGTTTQNQCGEYYHIAHNHALTQITSWGVVMTGMATYTRIDPPLPNNCP